MKYVHTNIISKNWKRLSTFYIDVFDCKIKPPRRNQSGKWLEQGTGVKNASLEGVHLELPGYGEGGPTLEIYQYAEIDSMGDNTPNREGFGHIAFEVDSVEEIVEKIEEKGGKQYGRITKRKIEGVGEITFVYVKDPDGNFIEIQNWQLES